MKLRAYLFLFLTLCLCFSNTSCANNDIVKEYNLEEENTTYNQETGKYEYDRTERLIIYFSYIGIGLNIGMISICKTTRFFTGIQSKCAESPFFKKEENKKSKKEVATEA